MVDLVIRVAQVNFPTSVGEMYWVGAASTHFWVDPVESLVVIFLSQVTAINLHALMALLPCFCFCPGRLLSRCPRLANSTAHLSGTAHCGGVV